MTHDIDSTKQADEWVFPEIDTLGDDEADFELENGSEELGEYEDAQMGARHTPKSIMDLQHDEQMLKLKEKEQEAARSAVLLQAILVKVKEPLAFLDDQLINIFQDILKKVVVKIIYKEIEIDPTLIKKMIDDLKSLIHTQHGLINIHLCEEDFKRIPMFSEEKDQSIVVDNNLKEGDIIINTKDTEIRALLSERVELLMGTLHD